MGVSAPETVRCAAASGRPARSRLGSSESNRSAIDSSPALGSSGVRVRTARSSRASRTIDGSSASPSGRQGTRHHGRRETEEECGHEFGRRGSKRRRSATRSSPSKSRASRSPRTTPGCPARSRRPHAAPPPHARNAVRVPDQPRPKCVTVSPPAVRATYTYGKGNLALIPPSHQRLCEPTSRRPVGTASPSANGWA